jgi:hypothetical protein
MRFPLKRREQVSNIMQILTENTRNVWIDRYRDEYTRIASHKVIATTALPESSASFPLTVPTSRLTQGILDRIYMKLIRDGAGMEPMGRENGRPVFTLITGPETSERVVVDGASIQTDFRYSTRVNELLQPLGVERSYKGFYHLIDDFPPRYDFVGGAWVRRWPWASEAATQGNKWEIDADYENAAYEDSFIFIPSVYTSLIPAPITSVGPLTFDSTNYRGDFKWKNIMDRVENPDGNWGYFRGIFANGSRPDNPQWGYVIRHQRCTSDLGLVVCS